MLSRESIKKDPKTRLQELLQSRQLPLPTYKVILIKGEPHRQSFYVQCSIVLCNDSINGVGNSRRKAEQHAAEQVLLLLREK